MERKSVNHILKLLFAIATCFAVLCGSIYDSNFNAEAKVTYIKKLKIAAGNSYRLTIKGKKGTIKWSSNKKSVAAVNKKGNVTAKKKGTAKVYGKLGGKTYTTTVKVYGNSGRNVRLTDTSTGAGGSTDISGSMQDTLTKVGQAIADRDTTINVAVNDSISASAYSQKLFSPTAGYVSDYDYLSMKSYAYSAVSTGSQINIKYTISYRITKAYNDTFIRKAKSIVAGFGGSDASKIKKIHDYLVNHVDYIDGGYTAYNALSDHGAVCEGYALAFYEMCKFAGVDCRVVTGTAYGSRGEGNHAWNVVKSGSTWYNMDVTWDDTTDSTKYYLKSTSAFPNHYADSRSKSFMSGMNLA
jgi:transglutaminase/protease-like cytokinesis protein 3